MAVCNKALERERRENPPWRIERQPWLDVPLLYPKGRIFVDSVPDVLIQDPNRNTNYLIPAHELERFRVDDVAGDPDVTYGISFMIDPAPEIR